jgi:hypothetical protein
MSVKPIHQCQCAVCLGDDPEHPDRHLHATINLLLSRLNEQPRRWLAALESQKLGHGGDKRLSEVTGLHPDTIRKGREELDAGLEGRPTDRVRNPGGGRPPLQKKIPSSSKP